MQIAFYYENIRKIERTKLKYIGSIHELYVVYV